MDYRILRDGVEVAQVHYWPAKWDKDNKLTFAFCYFLVNWVVGFEPNSYQFHRWEAKPL